MMTTATSPALQVLNSARRHLPSTAPSTAREQLPYAAAEKLQSGGPRAGSPPSPGSADFASEDGLTVQHVTLRDLARLSEAGTSDHTASDLHPVADDLLEDTDEMWLGVGAGGLDVKDPETNEELLAKLGDIADGTTVSDSSQREENSSSSSSGQGGSTDRHHHDHPFQHQRPAADIRPCEDKASELGPSPSENLDIAKSETAEGLDLLESIAARGAAATKRQTRREGGWRKQQSSLQQEVALLRLQVQEQLEAKELTELRLQGEVQQLQERIERQEEEKQALLDRLEAVTVGLNDLELESSGAQQQLIDRIEAEQAFNLELQRTTEMNVQQILEKAEDIHAATQPVSASQRALSEELQAVMREQAAAAVALKSERIATWQLFQDVFAVARFKAPPGVVSFIEATISGALASLDGEEQDEAARSRGSDLRSDAGSEERARVHDEVPPRRRGFWACRQLMKQQEREERRERGEEVEDEASPSASSFMSDISFPEMHLERPWPPPAPQQQPQEKAPMDRECWRLARGNAELSKELALEEMTKQQLEGLLEDSDKRARNSAVRLREGRGRAEPEEALRLYIDAGGMKEVGLNAGKTISHAQALHRAITDAEERLQRDVEAYTDAVQHLAVEHEELQTLDQNLEEQGEAHDQMLTAWLQAQEKSKEVTAKIQSVDAELVKVGGRDLTERLEDLEAMVQEEDTRLEALHAQRARLDDGFASPSGGLLRCLVPKKNNPKMELQSQSPASSSKAAAAGGSSPAGGKSGGKSFKGKGGSGSEGGVHQAQGTAGKGKGARGGQKGGAGKRGKSAGGRKGRGGGAAPAFASDDGQQPPRTPASMSGATAETRSLGGQSSASSSSGGAGVKGAGTGFFDSQAKGLRSGKGGGKMNGQLPLPLLREQDDV